MCFAFIIMVEHLTNTCALFIYNHENIVPRHIICSLNECSHGKCREIHVCVEYLYIRSKCLAELKLREPVENVL